MPNKWSFSRWATYNKCPHQAKLYYIDGVRGEEDPNSAASRGTIIHKMSEDYLNARRATELPPIFQQFAADFALLRKLRAVPEVSLGIRRDKTTGFQWTPCEFDDPNYWWHGQLDATAILECGTVAWIVDIKTGKMYDEHVLQLQLYAIAMFLHAPELDEVICEDWYVDLGKKVKHRFLRRQLQGLILLWERRTAAMFNDTTFPPTPTPLCGWCIASQENGLCKFALTEAEKEEKQAKSAARRKV